ncbi:MAG: cytochrome c3 family protein [Myxococcota bacterium]
MSRSAVMGSVLFVSLAATLGLGYATGVRGTGARSTADPVSPVVFPARPPRIRAAHEHPAHQRLRCERCHEGATDSQRAGELSRTREAACVACHREETNRDAPGFERCQRCHLNQVEGPTGRTTFRADVELAPRLRFSHQRHARLGVGCLSCHDGVNDGTTGRHLPSMESCLECHGGSGPTADDQCATCHVQLGDGRMRSRFPEGWLNPPRWLLGMHHDVDFLVRHRWVAADQGERCASCHSEDECADCHDGRVRIERVHPGDFLLTHTQVARRNDQQCRSCHSTQAFCTECHARLGLSTMSAPVVRATSRFHPPPEVWLRGPVLHGLEARRAMDNCVSCHSEQDCVSCHGALGVGGGISPHPPGFREDCRRLREQNDRACRLCHQDVERLCP